MDVQQQQRKQLEAPQVTHLNLSQLTSTRGNKYPIRHGNFTDHRL